MANINGQKLQMHTLVFYNFVICKNNFSYNNVYRESAW